MGGLFYAQILGEQVNYSAEMIVPPEELAVMR